MLEIDRWLKWQPSSKKFDDSPGCEPPKPPKAGFEGFEGSRSGQTQNFSDHATMQPDDVDSRPPAGKPDTPEGHELVEQIRSHRHDVIRILCQQNSWPVPLSYPEYFFRLRAAGFVPCSREDWEAEYGSDAERMARYKRLCRWGHAHGR